MPVFQGWCNSGPKFETQSPGNRLNPHMNLRIQLHEVFLPPSLCGHLWSQHGQLSASLASLGRCWLVTRIAWPRTWGPPKTSWCPDATKLLWFGAWETVLKFFLDWPDLFENSHGIALLALTKFGMTLLVVTLLVVTILFFQYLSTSLARNSSWCNWGPWSFIQT